MSNNIDLYVQEIEDSKQQIKQAIMVKGVTPTGGLSSFPEAILQIENNKKPELTELIQSIENNGLYEFYPEEGTDGFSSAHIAVDVPIPTFTTQTKSITVTQNGDYSIEPDSEYDGLSSVEVSVNVPTSSGDKQIVPNGFAFESGDMSQIDFGQYDWSMVYDGYQFFNATGSSSTRGVTNSTGDWSNFEQNFNGKLLSTANMFYYCQNLTSVPQLDTSNVLDMSYMFYYCTKLTSISQLDTSNVMDMNNMFYYCGNLTSIPQLDISNVTDMRYMFGYCRALTEVRFKGNPSNVSSVSNMFMSISSTGTLYYDSRYDYSEIIAAKPSKWTAVPYDVEEYESQLNQSN